MAIQSTTDVDTLLYEIKRKKVIKLELMIKRMRYVPVILGGLFIVGAILAHYSGLTLSFLHYAFLIAVFVTTVGQSINERTDWVLELSELKKELDDHKICRE